MGVVVAAGVYFSQNPKAWLSVLNWLQTTLPDLLFQSLNWILQPHNLSFFILFYQLIKYFSDTFLILSNKASSKDHKIKKISHITLNFILNSTAQTIIFLNLSFSYVSGICFMLSGLVDLVWCMIERHLINKEKVSLREKDLSSLAAKVRCLEQENYHDRKTQQLRVEGISLFLTLVASFLSIYFSPSVACIAAMCATFQFLISLTKTHYFNVIEKKHAANLQEKIAELYGNNSTPDEELPSSLSCLSLVKPL
jgi:hypothetical protein